MCITTVSLRTAIYMKNVNNKMINAFYKLLKTVKISKQEEKCIRVDLSRWRAGVSF